MRRLCWTRPDAHLGSDAHQSYASATLQHVVRLDTATIDARGELESEAQLDDYLERAKRLSPQKSLANMRF